MRPYLRSVLLLAGFCLSSTAAPLVFAPSSVAQGLASSDLSRLRSVGSVELSPEGRRIAYTVIMRDRPGRPYGQLWLMDVATQKSVRVGGEKDSGGGPLWSPDGEWLAFEGHQGEKGGLFLARPDGSEVTFLASLNGTNSPLPGTGNDVTWSPDGKQLAFVSSTPGLEAAEATGDPMVITRYLYKPDAGEGMTHFNDNQRLHIFVVEVSTAQVRQLTQGNFDEHSIDWSPDGKEILFASNREPNQDEFFNYDIFALKVSDNSIRRLTATEYSEYEPRWSPDGKRIVFRGTRRGLTDRETTMEDTHVWVMNANGSDRREIGAVLDNRQGVPRWAPDGSAVYFTLQERGSNHLVRLPICSERHGGRWRLVRGEGRCAGVQFRVATRRSGTPFQSGQRRAAQANGLECATLCGKTNRRSRVIHFHQQRQQVRSRGLSHQAAGDDRHIEASSHRQYSRRAARAKWSGIQF